MAEDIPSTPPLRMDDPSGQPQAQEPPPLDAVRIRSPQARGLNKPVILAAAGAGVMLVLLLASGAFLPGSSRTPAESKPMMSDPARPEMAKGAIRSLPATYTEAAARAPAPVAPDPPQLGPPLPGDIAAFAPPDMSLMGRAPDPVQSWEIQGPASGPAPAPVENKEEKTAERSGLMEQMHQERDSPES